MAGFVRRFTEFPTIEVLSEIEAVDIIDLAPPSPTTGIGTGALLCVGEYEDGAFSAGGDAVEYAGDLGTQEVFSSQDLLNKFGGFGFTYGSVPYNNPCARRHLSEDWNGNGFIKLKYCRPQRLLVGRVDTSVGSVAFSPLAVLLGDTVGPFNLAVADVLTITTSVGGPVSSTALAAVEATILGAPFLLSGFVGGETITVQIDGGVITSVTFTAVDQTPADVAARINAVLGFAAASVVLGGVEIVGLTQGTAGAVALADVSPGTLAAIGHVAGSTAGTGNVGNINAVTAAEIATIVNATVGLTAISAFATATSDGAVKVFCSVAGSGTVEVAATSMASVLGITTATTVVAGEHAAGTIPAGTRVNDGTGEWVTMQSLSIAAGTVTAPNAGPHIVKVRPAQDDGTAIGAASGTVTTVVDQPSFTDFAVNNAAALSAALTEAQMDVAYETALANTLSLTGPVREVNFSIVARRSPAVVRVGRTNALDASSGGLYGRKFITGAPLGFTLAQARTDVALYRTDRLSYTYPGWQVRIPEIAFRGAAGGTGFTESGIITVRGDAPLATICCRLPPESNPGQQTGLIEDFFQVESVGLNYGINEYIALKAAGICAPRKDRVSGSIYQSGVTSNITPGLTTQARRKMADYIQDSLGERMIPYSKKPNTEFRRDAIRGVVEAFLSELRALQNPELARIADFSVDQRSGNTPESEARGIFVLIVRVRTLSSLDAIVLQTEIGEGVVTTVEA
jgi:hypothetical protein